MALITSEVCSTVTNQADSQDFQRGVRGTERRGWVWERGLSQLKHIRSENVPVFESLRMALVITSHHKYVQLNASNHVLSYLVE